MNFERSLAGLLALLLAFSALLSPALAQEARPNVDKYRLDKGLALAGYDPVAYFPEFGGEAQKGKQEVTLEQRGVTYRFASEANREAFRAAPGRFEPAYGGWCAYAMSEDQRAKPDPTNFLIQNGRLMLFVKGGVFSGNKRDAFRKDQPYERETRANQRWQAFAGEAPAAIAEADRDRPDLLQMNLGDNGLALAGYDPLAYFEEFGGAPTPGQRSIAVGYRGVSYRFATPEHKAAFLADPARFEPSYGGWCAYAMAKGDKVEINPKSFLIQDGKLLVFYDGLLGNTRKQWLEGDTAAQARQANGVWAQFNAPPEPKSR